MLVRPHYKQSWPPMVHALSLWLSSVPFKEADKGKIGAGKFFTEKLFLIPSVCHGNMNFILFYTLRLITYSVCCDLFENPFFTAKFH